MQQKQPTPKLAINGWISLNKPTGITSARAVSIVKRTLRAKKLGHAGTLDPLASGVLPLALGEATKTVRFLMDAEKEYEFTIRWGQSTTTDDCEGEVVETADKTPTEKEILNVIPSFVGEVLQTPPIYSAIKVNGRRAYDLARKGEAVELQGRNILIKELSLLSMDAENSATFHVRCGKGTYVRSLARDIAEALGTKGHVTHLLRTKVGPFSIKDAILLENVENTVYNPPFSELVMPVERVLDDIPVLCLNSENANALRQGQKILLDGQQLSEEELVAVKTDEKLVAIVQKDGGYIKPVRIFNL